MLAEVYVEGVEEPYHIDITNWNEFEIYYLGGNVKKFVKVNDDVWINMDRITIVRKVQ